MRKNVKKLHEAFVAMLSEKEFVGKTPLFNKKNYRIMVHNEFDYTDASEIPQNLIHSIKANQGDPEDLYIFVPTSQWGKEAIVDAKPIKTPQYIIDSFTESAFYEALDNGSADVFIFPANQGNRCAYNLTFYSVTPGKITYACNAYKLNAGFNVDDILEQAKDNKMLVYTNNEFNRK